MFEQEEEEILYHADTTSVVTEMSEFNVCFSWQEPLEELSNKEINPNISDFVFARQPI